MMTSIQKTFALLLTALALALVYFLQPILTPFLAGMALAYLGDPLVDRLERYKLGRTLGVMLVFALFAIFLTLVLLVLLPLATRELGALIKNIPVYIRWLQDNTSPFIIGTFGIDPFAIDLDLLVGKLKDNWQQAGGLVGSLLAQITASGIAFLTALGTVALTPVVAFYMLRDWDGIMARIHQLVPRDQVPTFDRLLSECDEVLGAFLRGQLSVMFLLGCVYSLGLYLVGLDLAILIGMLAGLLSLVPYLGFIVGLLSATIAALFQFQELLPLGYVLAVFIAGQLLEGSLLTPWLVGDRIGLHPVAVIFAVLAGGQLFGFAGILLALPVAAVVMVFVRHWHHRYLGSGYYQSADQTDSQTES